jgi:phosphatidylserine/phosphatidylglycerophosphate/cardiolipin synthase-like enzyme
MRIFVSYASEQRPLAERLSHALRSEGHKVFFDRDSLPSGEAYAGKIQQEILASDLFVFLISPESLSARYALSELDVIQKAAPTAGKRVLPVTVAATPMETVPGYLRALTILNPKGDVVADTLHRVGEISAARRRIRLLVAALVVAVAAAGGLSYWRNDWTKVKPPSQVTLLRSLSLFREADQSSEIIGQLKVGEELTVTPVSGNPNWVKVHARSQDGWAMAQDIVAQESGGPGTIALGQGFGYQGSYWNLFFTSPQKEGRPPNRFGIDMRFADAIGRTQKTMDIAVFELNSKTITDALVEAHRRGVRVRVVTGQFGFDEKNQTFGQLGEAGIPIVIRPSKNHFMHNKFAILDGKTVWTGSWNYTEGATYSNNENALALEAQDIAQRYQSVFDQMFDRKLFGAQRKAVIPVPILSHGVQAMFAPEDPIVPELLKRVKAARQSIAFMAFSLTLEELAQAIVEQSWRLNVRAILEPKLARGSRASKSLCVTDAKVELRFASSPRFQHHDVFVIDGELVITGSTNFVRHMDVNDENILFLPDRLLANKYMAEFARLWAKGKAPDERFCEVQAE